MTNAANVRVIAVPDPRRYRLPVMGDRVVIAGCSCVVADITRLPNREWRVCVRDNDSVCVTVSLREFLRLAMCAEAA